MLRHQANEVPKALVCRDILEGVAEVSESVLRCFVMNITRIDGSCREVQRVFLLGCAGMHTM
jgi:hypothetical protein